MRGGDNVKSASQTESSVFAEIGGGASALPIRPLDIPRPVLWGFGIFLLGIVLAVYGPIMSYPRILDDWRWAYGLSDAPFFRALKQIVTSTGMTFYRPASALFHLMAWRAFGENVLIYHVVAIGLLTACGMLSALIAYAFTGRRLLAVGAGVLFVTASPIHMDSMLWSVGINDLGCTTGVLLAAWLLMQGRYRGSACMFLVAMSFKESAIWFPVFALAVLGFRSGWKMALRRWVAFLAAGLIYAAIRALNSMAVHVAPSSAYAVHGEASSVAGTALHYAVWLGQLLFPPLAGSPALDQWAEEMKTVPTVAISVALALALLFVFLIARALRGMGRGGAVEATLAVWLALAPLLFLFLPNHLYRYYLNLALLPFLLLFLIGASWALRCLRVKPDIERILLASIIAALAVGNGMFFRAREREGLHSRMVHGTNSLISRGASARMMENYIKSHREAFPEGAWIILSGLDTWGAYKSLGPRLWLNDRTVHACDVSDTRVDARGLYVSSQTVGIRAIMDLRTPPEKYYLKLSRVRALFVRDGKLQDATGEFLDACQQEARRMRNEASAAPVK